MPTIFKASKMATHPKVSKSNQHFFDLFKGSKITNLVYCYHRYYFNNLHCYHYQKCKKKFFCFSYKGAIYTA